MIHCVPSIPASRNATILVDRQEIIMPLIPRASQALVSARPFRLNAGPEHMTTAGFCGDHPAHLKPDDLRIRRVVQHARCGVLGRDRPAHEQASVSPCKLAAPCTLAESSHSATGE